VGFAPSDVTLVTVQAAKLAQAGFRRTAARHWKGCPQKAALFSVDQPPIETIKIFD
jgi:hypothetical protein